jgi:small subunit ribosomal protein S8e
VRTKTLVKSAVVQVDAAPFRAWYIQHYGKKIGIKVKNGEKVESEDITDVKRSNTLATKLKKRNAKHEVLPKAIYLIPCTL